MRTATFTGEPHGGHMTSDHPDRMLFNSNVKVKRSLTVDRQLALGVSDPADPRDGYFYFDNSNFFNFMIFRSLGAEHAQIYSYDNRLYLQGTNGLQLRDGNDPIAACDHDGLLVSWPLAKLGYAAGAGGAVAQSISKSTGVTLDKSCGQIAMNGAALAASTSVSFTLTNSAIAADDTVRVNIASGAAANSYLAQVDAVAAGSCRI